MYKTSKSRLESFRLRFAVLAIIAAGLFYAQMGLPSGENRLYAFDVGQGDSLLFVTAQNQKILIDGGAPGKLLPELSKVIPYFDRKIDVMIMTHPHTDHIDGLIEVLNRYQVDMIISSSSPYDSPDYIELLRTIEEKKVPFYLANAEIDWEFGDGVKLNILYPQENDLDSRLRNINNSSVISRLEFCSGEIKEDCDKTSILFPGDAEIEIWEELIDDNINLKSDILKVAHHGSTNGLNEQILNEVDPELAIISVGKNNTYGHPHQGTIDLLEKNNVKIHRTDIDGTGEWAGNQLRIGNEELRIGNGKWRNSTQRIAN